MDTMSFDRIREPSVQPGTDVMIFKRFSQKNLAKKSSFFTQTKGNFAEKSDHNIGF
jgi:hypothetical protein